MLVYSTDITLMLLNDLFDKNKIIIILTDLLDELWLTKYIISYIIDNDFINYKNMILLASVDNSSISESNVQNKGYMCWKLVSRTSKLINKMIFYKNIIFLLQLNGNVDIYNYNYFRTDMIIIDILKYITMHTLSSVIIENNTWSFLDLFRQSYKYKINNDCISYNCETNSIVGLDQNIHKIKYKYKYASNTNCKHDDQNMV